MPALFRVNTVAFLRQTAWFISAGKLQQRNTMEAVLLQVDLLSEDAEDAFTAVRCCGLCCLAVRFNLWLKSDKNSTKFSNMGNMLN